MKSLKGYGFFIVMLLVVLLAYISSDYFMNADKAGYTIAQFKEDISSNKVQDVEVVQNAEVPTGELLVKYAKETRRLYVPDVNEIVRYLEEIHFSQVKIRDVARTPWYLEILPYIIGFVLILLLFSMMTSNASGGGGGGKMMNFGKSRARLTMPDDKVKTFADVAGLVEEKEQLEEIVDFLSSPALLWLVLREPEKRCLPKLWQEKPACHFSVFPVRILSKCLSESGLPVSEICLQKQKRMHRVSYLLMRLMPWRDAEAAVLAAVMTRGSRRSIRCLSRWTDLASTRELS